MTCLLNLKLQYDFLAFIANSFRVTVVSNTISHNIQNRHILIFISLYNQFQDIVHLSLKVVAFINNIASRP